MSGAGRRGTELREQDVVGAEGSGAGSGSQMKHVHSAYCPTFVKKIMY